MWIDAYDAVTTRGGRYVQGGGCTTVGVAGLVQSGGFGSFSKRYGTAAAGLLEAEIVTADGQVRIANACTHPDLFWAIKGGGGGSLGVVTRLTLRTRELPEFFGGVSGSIKAASDAAYRALIAQGASPSTSDALFNPHWGEQIGFGSDNTVRSRHGVPGAEQAAGRGRSGRRSSTGCARAGEYELTKAGPGAGVAGAAHVGCRHSSASTRPASMVADDRPGAPRTHVLWAGDQGQVGLVHPWLQIGVVAGVVVARSSGRRNWLTPCSPARAIGA